MERLKLTEALNMSCPLKHMAAAACGQRTKSQSSSGRSPGKKGGGPNRGRAEGLDGGSTPPDGRTDGRSALRTPAGFHMD